MLHNVKNKHFKILIMEKTIKETTRLLAQGIITRDEADKILLGLLGVSQRTFTSTCEEVESMAVEIDQFINQHALVKPMTYSRKLRQYLANKLNEYVC
jgi:hypothetical protein